MAPKKTRFVLRHIGTRASRQNGDLLLNLLDVVFARFKINLSWRATSQLFAAQEAVANGIGGQRTCLMATISPVSFSMALYTIPKLPPSHHVSSLQTNPGKNTGERLTSQLLQHLISTRHVCHGCATVNDRNTAMYSVCTCRNEVIAQGGRIENGDMTMIRQSNTKNAHPQSARSLRLVANS